LDNVMKAFRDFDKDGSGTIETEELMTVLKKLDAKAWTDANIKKLMESIDANGDGIIQFDEFIDWSFSSFKEMGFRNLLGLKKPKVTWTAFSLTVSDEGVQKKFEKVHPSHKMVMFFNRLSVSTLKPAAELILCQGDVQISYGSIGDGQCMADYDFDAFCLPDAAIPVFSLKEKPVVDAQITELQAIRTEYDKKLCDPLQGIWYAKKVNELRACANWLDEPGFECKIAVVQKKKSSKNKGEETEDYPQIVFFIGDRENPATIYGKQTFKLFGQPPPCQKGYPIGKWKDVADTIGILNSEKVHTELEELRNEAKHEGGELKKHQGTDMQKIAAAEKVMTDAYKKVEMMPWSSAERKIIEDVVAPLATKIWHKIGVSEDAENDGKYVSNTKEDGFEMGPPIDTEGPKGKGGEYFQNTVFIRSDKLRLRIFKALGLADHHTTDKSFDPAEAAAQAAKRAAAQAAWHEAAEAPARAAALAAAKAASDAAAEAAAEAAAQAAAEAAAQEAAEAAPA